MVAGFIAYDLLDRAEKAERERDEYGALLKDDNGIGAMHRELELLRELEKWYRENPGVPTHKHWIECNCVACDVLYELDAIRDGQKEGAR